jgi:hypothetical protein
VAPPSRRFVSRLALVTLLGLAVRLAFVLLVRRHQQVWGDTYVYHWGARLLAEGHGFIEPLRYNAFGVAKQSAAEPPLFVGLLAAFSLVGLKSFLTHKIICAFIGTCTVAAMGLLGREVGDQMWGERRGERIGLLSAFVVAIYPNFWLHDRMVMSETLTLFLVTIAIWMAYRLWRAPSYRRGVAFAVAGTLAALVHPDSLMLLPLATIPIAIGLRQWSWWRRIGLVGVVGATAVLLVSPWVAYNFSRFEEPIFLSDGQDITMAVSNCDQAWHGEFRGFWYMPCASAVTPPPGDQSQEGVFWRKRALNYIGDHLDEVPGVLVAKVGRVWGFYRPIQQWSLEELEGHDRWVAQIASGFYYVLMPFAIYGLVRIKRRGLPISPLVAMAALVTIAAMITFGNTRYRAQAEVAIVTAAAVGIEAVWMRRRERNPPGLSVTSVSHGDPKSPKAGDEMAAGAAVG